MRSRSSVVPCSRRTFHQVAGAAALAATFPATTTADHTSSGRRSSFGLRYIVASCMYGKAPLDEILEQVPETGAEHIELWSEPHGNQREQLEDLGVQRFRAMLEEHGVRLGGFTCFKVGVFGMQPEMEMVRQLGGDLVICNTGGPAGLEGRELTEAVDAFAERLRPHVAVAEELGITIGIENHSRCLINSRESQLRLLDRIQTPHLGIAMAPYHLPQDAGAIASLIGELRERLVHFQAWQYGKGCHEPMPKADEMMQLPGRGPLDFTLLVAALRDIAYTGRTEIFMHPTPRGIPILPELHEVTAAINESRQYLEHCLQTIS